MYLIINTKLVKKAVFVKIRFVINFCVKFFLIILDYDWLSQYVMPICRYISSDWNDKRIKYYYNNNKCKKL